jgi:hypothetical protein
MKLFTIGESICQGFMSGAAARTDLSFSSLIARAMKDATYRIPAWPKGGLPFNAEVLLRRLEKRAGADVSLFEWPTVIAAVNGYMDEVEDYYEREEGAADKPSSDQAKFYNNVSVYGFQVADAWQYTPRFARSQIKKKSKTWSSDGLFSLPSGHQARTALQVLNPSKDPKYDDYSALRWLEEHHQREGVENVIIWLGSNNALGTILSMNIKATHGPGSAYHKDLGPEAREEFNLWSPEHFADDYRTLLGMVDEIMTKNPHKKDWRVFLGTVPAVTVAPLAKGVGETLPKSDPFGVLQGPDPLYFKYLT